MKYVVAVCLGIIVIFMVGMMFVLSANMVVSGYWLAGALTFVVDVAIAVLVAAGGYYLWREFA